MLSIVSAYLFYNSNQEKLILDSTLSGSQFGTEYGTTRTCELKSNSIKLRLRRMKNGESIFNW